MPNTMLTTDTELVMRRAREADAPALERLAALDSSSVPRGELLVAEVGGRLVAAVPVNGGHTIADPFAPTAATLELLALRSAQLRAARDARGNGRAGLARLRTRLAG